MILNEESFQEAFFEIVSNSEYYWLATWIYHLKLLFLVSLYRTERGSYKLGFISRLVCHAERLLHT